MDRSEELPELTTTWHDEWDQSDGEPVIWESADDATWRVKGSSDPGLTLAETIAPREGLHLPPGRPASDRRHWRLGHGR